MITSRKEEVGVALQKYFLRFLEASGGRHMMHNFRREKRREERDAIMELRKSLGLGDFQDFEG
jgi:hypothetical protein